MAEAPFAADAHADFLAVITTRDQWTFASWGDAALRAEQRLRALGVTRGQRVGLALGQTVEGLVTLRALAQLGAVACIIDPRRPRDETARAMRACGCSRLIAEALDLERAATNLLSDVVDLDQPATVVLTSGSTGDPKPVLHSLGNHLDSAAAANANMTLQPGDRWLLSLPLHHVAGLGVVFRCAIAGAAVAVPEARMTLPDTIEALKPTHLSLVPTQLYRLLSDDRATRALANVKSILMGGAPMPLSLVWRAVDRGIPIHTSYGLTETASQITATRPGDGLNALLTSGAPLTPGTVSISTEGEILVRGKTLFLGYARDGGVERPLTGDGWFATGDLGRFDDCGRLVVTGRRDNMFISGGENVQPEEVERRLCELSGVEQALVLPVDDPEFGQVGVALVRMWNSAPPDADRLKAQLREQLPAYKVPKRFLPWPQDLEAGGKIDRRRIQSLCGL